MIKLFEVHTINNTKEEIPLLFSTFPAGEEFVRINTELNYYGYADYVYIVEAVIKNSTDLMRVILLGNAIKNYKKINNKKKITLVIDYFPYSRQDRICSIGESDSYAAVELLLSTVYTTIETLDLHNPDVRTPEFVKNKKPDEVFTAIKMFEGQYTIQFQLNVLESIINATIDSYKKVGVQYPNIDFLKDAIQNNIKKEINEINKLTHLKEKIGLVLPDKDAYERYKYVTDKFSNIEVFIGSKPRIDGKLNGFDVNCQDFQGRHLLIIDDLCDAGGTFLGLGKVLKERNAGDLHLYVTHGIFSKGLATLEKMFKHIYTSDSYFDKDVYNKEMVNYPLYHVSNVLK